MEKSDGRFKKGEHRSPKTEFKPGEHWRKPQLFRDADWLRHEYVDLERSAGDIAKQFGVTDAAVMFWLRKHGIPRRSISEARALKHWGSSGEDNPMFGKRGAEVPNWKGGITADRQAFYASLEWAECVKEIWKRDRGTCQRCGVRANKHGNFHIHHIVSFKVKELRAETSNLILLCPDCHRWVHSKANVDHEFVK